MIKIVFKKTVKFCDKITTDCFYLSMIYYYLQLQFDQLNLNFNLMKKKLKKTFGKIDFKNFV